jgi:hypothetical protein
VREWFPEPYRGLPEGQVDAAVVVAADGAGPEPRQPRGGLAEQQDQDRAEAVAGFLVLVAEQAGRQGDPVLVVQYNKGQDWARKTRAFYDSGLFALLVGLGLVVVPPHAAGIQGFFRWLAVGLAGLALLVHLVWKRRERWPRSG